MVMLHCPLHSLISQSLSILARLHLFLVGSLKFVGWFLAYLPSLVAGNNKIRYHIHKKSNIDTFMCSSGLTYLQPRAVSACYTSLEHGKKINVFARGGPTVSWARALGRHSICLFQWTRTNTLWSEVIKVMFSFQKFSRFSVTSNFWTHA